MRRVAALFAFRAEVPAPPPVPAKPAPKPEKGEPPKGCNAKGRCFPPPPGGTVFLKACGVAVLALLAMCLAGCPKRCRSSRDCGAGYACFGGGDEGPGICLKNAASCVASAQAGDRESISACVEPE